MSNQLLLAEKTETQQFTVAASLMIATCSYNLKNNDKYSMKCYFNISDFNQ